MKPSHNPRWNDTDAQRSINTGREVAKMVTKLGLEKKAFLVSFDPVKVWAAKKQNPNLVTGSFYSTGDWERDMANMNKLKSQYQTEFGLTNCLSKAPNGRAFMEFLFNSGTIFKAINASFLDMDYKIYDNPKYTNNTFATLRKNYSPKVSAGAWTIYNMKMTSKEIEASEKQVQSLIDQGAERLITDDVPKLRKKLGRGKQPSESFGLSANMTLIFVSLVLVKVL